MPACSAEMRFIWIWVVCAACGEVRQAHRWPDHRKQHDEELATLQDKVARLEAEVHSLEQLVKSLQAHPAEER